MQKCCTAIIYPRSKRDNPRKLRDRPLFFWWVGGQFSGTLNFFLTFKLCIILFFFLWLAIACAKICQSQTEDLDSRKHLFDFFPMAPLRQFFFSCFCWAGIFFWKLPNPPPTPSKNNGPFLKCVWQKNKILLVSWQGWKSWDEKKVNLISICTVVLIKVSMLYC